MSKRKLSALQKRFAKEYVAQGEINATLAAKKAGYSKKWAGKIAYRLVGNDRIQAFMHTLKRETVDAADLSIELVMEAVTKGVVRGNTELTKLAARMLNIEDGVKDPSKKHRTLKYNLEKEPETEGNK